MYFSLEMFFFFLLDIQISWCLKLNVCVDREKHAYDTSYYCLLKKKKQSHHSIRTFIKPSQHSSIISSKQDLLFPLHNETFQMGKATLCQYYWKCSPIFSVIPRWLQFYCSQIFRFQPIDPIDCGLRGSHNWPAVHKSWQALCIRHSRRHTPSFNGKVQTVKW